MTQQAFSLARKKIKWEALLEIFRATVRGSYNEELNDRRGYLPMAIDGSRVALPPDAALREYYGAIGPEHSAATARASVPVDIENDIIVDAKIEPLKEDERSLAKKHIDVLAGMDFNSMGKKPLLIFDRGYPSKDLIKYIEELVPKLIDYALKRIVRKLCLRWNKLLEKSV
jgi:hypothetical protein